MPDRAIELAKECGLDQIIRLRNGNSLVIPVKVIQDFYSAAKREGAAEMRETAAIEADCYRATNVSKAIRELRIENE